MLEIRVSLTSRTRGKKFQVWLYRSGTGNDIQKGDEEVDTSSQNGFVRAKRILGWSCYGGCPPAE